MKRDRSDPLNAPHFSVPLAGNIKKAGLFQWIRKQNPRPERPQVSLSNLKAKEAENRPATRDQAPLKGENVAFWPFVPHLLKSLVFH